jgi:hypothetical protein
MGTIASRYGVMDESRDGKLKAAPVRERGGGGDSFVYERIAVLADEVEALRKRVVLLEARGESAKVVKRLEAEAAGEPWVAAGVSKATWYRRRARAGEG